MPNRFDAVLKELFVSPLALGGPFALPTIQPAVALNVDLSTISAATDVAIGFGDPIQEIVDLNFQSGPDPKVASRCHLYSAALHRRFDVCVRTILVLLRPKADSSEITGKMTYASGSSRVEFTYEVVRMWERRADDFPHAAVQWLPLATLCEVPAGRPLTDALRDIVARIDCRLVAECESAQAVRLMTAAFILTGLRVEHSAHGSIYQGISVMQHETTAFDYYAEQGAIKEAQRLLLRLGKKRLEQPDDATLAQLKEIRDVDRLERMGEVMMTASSWKEVLTTP